MAQTKLKFPQALAYCFPAGHLINGKIDVSVASNNLTVALKTMAGNDPTPADPIYIRIRDTVYTLTNAKSFTVNAGTNWANLGAYETAGYEADLFLYVSYSTADAKLYIGASRISHARYAGDFNGYTTGEKALLYNQVDIPNASGTDEFEVIGRFAAILSASPNYNWSLPTMNSYNLVQHPIFESEWRTAKTAWTSSGTQPAIGNGLNWAYYKVVMRRVWINFYFSPGSTSTYGSGAYNFSLPFIVGGPGLVQPNMCFTDSGVTNYTFPITCYSTNKFFNVYHRISDNAVVNITPTAPFTWSTNDNLIGEITYWL